MRLTPYRVLVADDDPTVGLLARAALPGDTFAVSVAECGTSALALFRASPFDIVLLDVEMPGLDGFEVCTEIRRSHGSDFPVLLVTSHHDADFLARAHELSAGYIGKPVNWFGLAALLRGLVA